MITNHFKTKQNKIKKLLTGADDYDNISELLKTTKNIDNWTVNNLERFKTGRACQKKIIDFLPGFERSPRVKFKSSKDERTAFDKANLKNSKTWIKIPVGTCFWFRKPDILAGLKLFNMRVWSWLRMNAGGVLNTCKSNEALLSISSEWSFSDWVADGWVTRG